MNPSPKTPSDDSIVAESIKQVEDSLLSYSATKEMLEKDGDKELLFFDKMHTKYFKWCKPLDSYVAFSRTQLIQSLRGVKFRDENGEPHPFIKTYLCDGSKISYKSSDLFYNQEFVPPGWKNREPPFAGSLIKQYTYDGEAVLKWVDLVWALTGDENRGEPGADPTIMTASARHKITTLMDTLVRGGEPKGTGLETLAWVLKWVAHTIQRPGEESFHLVIRGNEGVGMTTFYYMLKQILGRSKCCMSSGGKRLPSYLICLDHQSEKVIAKNSGTTLDPKNCHRFLSTTNRLTANPSFSTQRTHMEVFASTRLIENKRHFKQMKEELGIFSAQGYEGVDNRVASLYNFFANINVDDFLETGPIAPKPQVKRIRLSKGKNE